MEIQNAVFGVLFWGAVALIIYRIRPRSFIHKVEMTNIGRKGKSIVLIVLVITIVVCILPMSASPYYNGEIPDHRNQYEMMAESILQGHLYIDYDDVDSRLGDMDNPYDPAEREEIGVNYHWDHAYYNGHYYMYFGVVPVFLLFLPYRIITGSALITYKATQLFAAAAIFGTFSLFYELTLAFSKKLSFSVYLFLSMAFSVMSVWYSIDTPALYSTAIISAVCLEVWSLFFFVKGVYIEEEEHKQIIYAFLGALFGALTFGCRPPVALANLLVIPMLITFLRQREIVLNRIWKVALAATPYVVVAVLLMLYNYLRFDNPFEFGQAYQLTSADQHLYGSFGDTFVWYRQINLILYNFIYYRDLSDKFPYIFYGGVYVNFPILLLTYIGGGQECIQKRIKNLKIGFFVCALGLMPIIITFIDALWAPNLGERYRMDIYFLLGILCFLIIAIWYETISDEMKPVFACIICAMCVATLFKCFILFMIPNDSNLTDVYPELLEKFQSIILFWTYL